MGIYAILGAMILALSLTGEVALASEIALKSIGLATGDRDTRLLFDLSAPAKASLALDASRRKLSVHLEQTALSARLKQPPAGHPLIGRIGASDDAEGMTVRVDLKKAVDVRGFPDRSTHRWIVQLREARPAVQTGSPEQSSSVPDKHQKAPPLSVLPSKAGARHPWVVAIDAGHGGKDTGAIGPGGVLEKDVVFSIARKLAGMIRAEPGMRAVMTRRSDQFIELQRRAEIARSARADLFVSLHADADDNSHAMGSSVYTLSEHGASSVAARWLADRENSADLVGGVKLQNKNKVLASVLLDLSQNATGEDSHKAATGILKELQKTWHLHHRDVQKAGFMVLKSPDVPSVLVETAFISNPVEEKHLIDGRHQERIARAVFWGIRAYFSGRSRSAQGKPAPKAATGRADLVAQE